MKEGPDISIIAALIGNPASANMLMALMAGPALTATELAQEAGLTLSTASGHLAKLEAAGLVAVERQGRHRYFRRCPLRQKRQCHHEQRPRRQARNRHPAICRNPPWGTC